MRRWNGWGESSITKEITEAGLEFLGQKVGAGEIISDACKEDVLATVPASRVDHELVDTTPETRLLHSRGQSFPDWLALKSGQVEHFPDAVARPKDAAQIRALLAWASDRGVKLIPYGGGTSVVGHLTPLSDGQPIVTVDMREMNRLLSLDTTSRLATIQAGATGPQIEEQLGQHGYVLGHYPQSFEYSTLGGWVASRSSGQQSYHYGRIEDLYAGGSFETFRGTMNLPPLPASGAGPDIKQMVLGSEGRLGFITEAVVRVRPLAQNESFHGVVFDDWSSGLEAVREMAQSGVGVSMARLSDPDESQVSIMLSGSSRKAGFVDKALRVVGYGDGRSVMIFGVTGSRAHCLGAIADAYSIARRHGGLPTGTPLGKAWAKNRFSSPYMRNTAWDAGYSIDTLETAVPWLGVMTTATKIKDAIRRQAEAMGERVLVFSHLSHLYPDGASIYVTYLFRRSAGHDENMERWRRMKTAASETIVECKATISHQHGVGTDHAPYLAAEKSEEGMRWLRALSKDADPQGLLNPGKLIPKA